MPINVEEIQSQVNIKNLFHTTIMNVDTYKDLVSRKLIEFRRYHVDVKNRNVPYLDGNIEQNKFPTIVILI
jgi:hypothetical protein